MVTARRQLLITALKLFDLLVMVCCFAAAAYVELRYTHSAQSFSELFAMRVKLGNILLFVALLLIWHVIFAAFGMYGSRRMGRRRYDVIDITKATSTATVFILLISVAFTIKMVTPLFLAVFWVYVATISIGTRFALRAALGRVRVHG
ncbi:MAG: hypothetical protein ABSE92_14635, partial [Terriglobales bacterium]